MNSRYIFAITFLLSLFQITTAKQYDDIILSDFDLCRCDCGPSLQRIDISTTDIEVAIAYLLSKDIPHCSFDTKGRVKKEALKYFIDRYITNGSLDLSAQLPNVGEVSVLSNDQVLEVGYAVTQDFFNKKTANDILTTASRTFLREKVVGIILWLISQSNIENLLPDTLTGSRLYDVIRNEVTRYGVDNLLITASARLNK